MGKPIDLYNQIFGFWKVLELDSEKTEEKRERYWKCECQLCGAINSVRGSALRSGKSTKCDECNKHKVTTDEVGNVYEKLTVKSYAGTKNNRKMWLCQCECNNYIEVSTTDLRDGSVRSCGKCPTSMSLGANAVKRLLDNANIDYVQEYSFEDFRYENGYRPRFDFYIKSKNYIIEYDGIQHYHYDSSPKSWNTKEKMLQTQEYDKIKNNYCHIHNIPIIRIPYTVPISQLTIFDLIPETSKYIVKEV